MKANFLDKLLLGSAERKDVSLTGKSAHIRWNDLILEINQKWNLLRRVKEVSRENGVKLIYKFDRSNSDFVKFSVHFTHDRYKTITKEFKSADKRTEITERRGTPNGAVGFSSRRKVLRKPKRIFWKRAPGSYGSTQ